MYSNLIIIRERCNYVVNQTANFLDTFISDRKRELRAVERVYVNGILQNGLESGNNTPFWKYVK